jgi:hypothetical protein
MNQAVENVFAKMFAPKAIPIEVIKLYDKVNFFVQRSGLPGLRVVDMCIIAGLAMDKGARLQENETRDRDGHEIIDTSEDDTETPVESVDMVVQDEDGTYQVNPLDDLPPETIEERKMDAPPAADPGDKRKAGIEALLSKMTKDELLAHATGVIGIPINTIVGRERGKASQVEINKVKKDKIIKIILENSK